MVKKALYSYSFANNTKPILIQTGAASWDYNIDTANNTLQAANMSTSPLVFFRRGGARAWVGRGESGTWTCSAVQL